MPVSSGTENWIQRLDVKTRLFIALVFSVGIIFINTWEALTLLAVAGLGYSAAHGRFKIIALVHAGLLVLFCLALLSVQLLLIFMPGLGDDGLGPFINPFLRTMILANVVLALALSCRTQELMETFRRLKLPFFIYLPATVTVRFIPGFIHDIRQIRESVLIKGYRLNLFFITFHPLLAMRLLLVPVVIRSLRTADELAVASELKGIRQESFVTSGGFGLPGYADLFAGVTALCLMGAGLWHSGVVQ